MFKKSHVIAFVLMCISKVCLGKGNKFYTQTVTTTSGAVRGTQLKIGDENVMAFLGIPFAEAPIGDLRFKKPLPIKPWDGVFDAVSKPPPCMQCSNSNVPWVSKATPSEDCLFLNIWIPNRPFATGLPVLVWIHGGGFYSGSTELDLYDGATVAAKGNVVLVSMNYRVGVFGFLNSGTDAPGNMGLYDQNLALKWIKANIRNFCGNEDSITIFGESAGSISVGMHIVSPLSKNLFNRAIMQSGSPYHPLLAEDKTMSMKKANFFASSVGCANEKADPNLVVACLKRKDAFDLAKAESLIIEKAPYYFGPAYGDEFMPRSLIEIVNSGDFTPIEVLIGNNYDEGSIFLHLLVPHIFGIDSTPDLSLTQAKMIISGLFQTIKNPPPEAIAEFYLKNIADNDTEAIRKAIYNSYGDYLFKCPSVFFAEKMRSSVYYYVFTHRPSNSLLGKWMGVAHFDEVPFTFGIPIRNSEYFTEEEGKLSNSIIEKWTSFAKDGLPLGKESTKSWPKYTSSNPQYIELSTHPSGIQNGPRTEACYFWRNYFSTSL